MADAEPESLTPFSFTRTLRNLEATHLVARVLAPLLRTGDVVTLNGTLGTGKTAFARALLRILAQDSTLEVPSPTFTLLQIYDTPSMAVVHADLYRINDPEEIEELGWDEAAQDALMLVEWPDRLGPLTPQSRLDLSFSLTNEDLDTRILTITGYGEWAERLQTFHRLQDFLERSGFGAARRIPIQGDASTRAYERLEMDGKSVIFMIAPKRPDGPPIRWGKSYSALAHLSESVDAFVAMADALRKQGLSAPEIYAQDLEHGLLIVEDLGHEGIVTAGQPVEERYQAAVDVLADLHRHPLPLRLPVKGADDHMLPLYDLDALGIETELLLDWYIPHHLNKELSANARSQFVSLWRETLTPVTEQDPTWTLRDYHSPNLLWLPAREGRLILDPGDFYILASREKLAIPSDLAVEMAPMDAAIGEFRVHYAGFFDPGFGLGADGKPSARGVLEVRSREVPFILEDGQFIGRLVYEQMCEPPQALYGQTGVSNYQGQSLKLSKHFRAA